MYAIRSYYAGQIVQAYNSSYPSNLDITNSVTIVYKAGYGDAAISVPAKTIAAIKLLCSHWYDFRTSVLVGSVSKEIEFGVQNLLNARTWNA